MFKKRLEKKTTTIKICRNYKKNKREKNKNFPKKDQLVNKKSVNVI